MLRRRWRASTFSSEILPGNIIAPEAGTLSTPGSELNIDTTHILAESSMHHLNQNRNDSPEITCQDQATHPFCLEPKAPNQLPATSTSSSAALRARSSSSSIPLKRPWLTAINTESAAHISQPTIQHTTAMLTTHPLPSLKNIEKLLPCGDISHHQPLFFPTTCHHPHKVLVADLEEGMGTLVHKGSMRNPAFGLWPLSQAVVQTVRRAAEGREEGGEQEVEGGEGVEEGMSLSAFLGWGNDDKDWEVVERPVVVQEKFVLVGKREVGGVCAVQSEWVDVRMLLS